MAPLSMKTTLTYALLLLAFALGAWNAHRFLGYVCDDAVISFRSVQHFGEGHGFVFNVGERIETFTNLLWVWLLTLAQAFGVSLFDAATWMGFAFTLLVLVGTLLLARTVLPFEVGWAPVFLVAASTTSMGQAGNGLETALFTCLATLGVASLLREGGQSDGADGALPRSGLGAALLALCCLTRPDAVCLLAGAVFLKCAWLRRTHRLRGLGADVLASLLVLGPALLFKFLHYDGQLVPNSVVAKAGARPDAAVLADGVRYVLAWCRSEFGTAWIAVGIVGSLAMGRRGQVLAVLCGGWFAYVVLTGGDFMPYHRFIAHVFPLVVVTMVAGWWRMLRPAVERSPGWIAGLACLLVFALAGDTLQRSMGEGNVPQKNARGEAFRAAVGVWFEERAAERAQPLVVAGNPAGFLGYFAGSETRFVDMLGITDPHIARQGRWDRSHWPGHQRGDGAYVLRVAPDYVLLGTATPGDVWQRPGAATLLERIVEEGLASVLATSDWHPYLTDRELLGDERFHAHYALEEHTLPGGSTFRVFARRAPAGG